MHYAYIVYIDFYVFNKYPEFRDVDKIHKDLSAEHDNDATCETSYLLLYRSRWMCNFRQLSCVFRHDQLT